MKLATCIFLGCLAAPTFAQDPCSAATSAVTIGEFTTGDGSVDAKGTWQAGGGASGIMLEFRMDNDRIRIETWSGASGTWQISSMSPKEAKCGRHTLRVHAYPSVKLGEGQLHCVGKGASAPRQFEFSCAPIVEIVDCNWECGGGETPQCTGTCTAQASRGRLTYAPFWGVNGEGWQPGGEASEGPWTHPVACAPGQRISFKVRDRDGRGLWSEVDEIGCGVTE